MPCGHSVTVQRNDHSGNLKVFLFHWPSGRWHLNKGQTNWLCCYELNLLKLRLMSWSLVRHSLRFVVSFSLSKGSKVSRVSKVSKYQGIKEQKYQKYPKDKSWILQRKKFSFKSNFLSRVQKIDFYFSIEPNWCLQYQVASKLQFKADFYNRMQNVFNNL